MNRSAGPRLSASPLPTRMAHGIFWTVCGSVAIQGAGLLGSILCARILGESSFGEFAIVRSTLLMLGVLAGSGMGVVATKYVAEYRETDRGRAGRMIGLLIRVSAFCGGGIGFSCLLLASPLAVWGMNAEHLSLALRIGCLLPLLYSLSGVQLGVLAGLESFQSVAWLNSLDAILILAFGVGGAWTSGVDGAVLGLVTAATTAFFVKHRTVASQCFRRGMRFSVPTCRTERSEVWRGALPAILLGLVFFPFDWFTRLLLTRQPGGFSELGIFTAAHMWGQMVLFLPAQAVGPTQALFANLLGSGHVASFRRLVAITVVSAAGLAILVAIALSVLSRQIMAAYGASFGEGWRTLVLVALAHVFYASTMPFKSILITLGKIWSQTLHHCILGATLLLSAVLLRHHGASGLALAHVIAWFVMFVCQALVVIGAMRHYGSARV